MWEQIQEERLRGAAGFAQIIAGNAAGSPPADMAGDVIWALIDTSLYHRLVIDRGWSKPRFQDWLADTIQAQLLPPGDWQDQHHAHDSPGQ